jgi:ring-1,2-phenylacetyl-CoA epoxidase subunit PaaD
MTARRGTAGTGPDEPVVDVRAVLAALEDVPDPEIPTVSIVELGMIGNVEVHDAGIRVELLPTFVGCPALEVIRDSVGGRLADFGRPVRVDVTFSTPWSTDRISPTGREKLRGSGFAPPPHVRPGRALPVLTGAPVTGAPARGARQALEAASTGGASEPGEPAGVEAVACPYCGSSRTTLENAFGPTQCRSIRHCPDCRQPFEAFKAI